MVTRCHHHEAWSVVVELRLQQLEEPVVLQETRVDFGPFDSDETIGVRIATALRSTLDAHRAL